MGDLAAIAIALAAFALLAASIWLIGKVELMGAGDVAGLVVSAVLFVYLCYALFRPERF